MDEKEEGSEGAPLARVPCSICGRENCRREDSAIAAAECYQHAWEGEKQFLDSTMHWQGRALAAEAWRKEAEALLATFDAESREKLRAAYPTLFREGERG